MLLECVHEHWQSLCWQLQLLFLQPALMHQVEAAKLLLLLPLLKRVLCCVVPAAEGVVALLSCRRDLCDEALAPCVALVKASC